MAGPIASARSAQSELVSGPEGWVPFEADYTSTTGDEVTIRGRIHRASDAFG